MALFSDVLLTVDFDRTLTAPDSTIPERNLEAIRYFMENGGAFTVNTGRSMPMARTFLDRVPVNAPLLLYNGALAYDTREDRIVFSHTIALDQAQTIRRCLELFPDLMVEIQGLDHHYRFTDNPAWEAFTAANYCSWQAAAPEDDLGPFLKFSVYGQIRKPTVADLFTGTPEEIRRIDQAQEMLRAQFGDAVEPVRSAPRIIDVQVRGVSKGRSARELQAALGRKILVCVGDAENDLTMLSSADFAFVPGDAILADRFPNVCPCAEGSVADVICKKIPEILKNNP